MYVAEKYLEVFEDEEVKRCEEKMKHYIKNNSPIDLDELDEYIIPWQQKIQELTLRMASNL